MSKAKKDMMKLDLYEILDVPFGASEADIKKSYRKKALKCHPDKNPDNANAAEEFDNLKKILEILLDVGARAAYDRVLKSRKEAAIRNRERSKEEQALRAKLEERERQAAGRPQLSEEERFRRELKRLEEEGERLIQEEIEKLNQEVVNEMRSSNTSSNNSKPSSQKPSVFRVKAKWVVTSDWPGYTEKEIHQLFYKWGDINAMVMKQKGSKGTAMIDYANYQGADMAVQFEKGMIGKPIEVSHITPETMKKPDKKDDKKEDSKTESKSASGNNYQFESVAEMNRRRQAERQKLIEEMMKEEGNS